ncbi:HNH endonuclease [Rhodococcus pyridinivorans]|uniref:HNH endonuclease n=1 Tax=Rhodococcus pyridinivorans TaxID=103816 RepID=UPI0021FBD1BC|nr:HNH endonuclease [Rhodococcus pyridinivorans]
MEGQTVVTPRTATTRWKKIRVRLIHTRDHICHHCGAPLNPDAKRGEPGSIEIDHLIPYAQRPDLAHDPNNLVLSCRPCNLSKGARTLDQPYQPPTHMLPLPTSRAW